MAPESTKPTAVPAPPTKHRLSQRDNVACSLWANERAMAIIKEASADGVSTEMAVKRLNLVSALLKGGA